MMNLGWRLRADKGILLDERNGIWSYSTEVFKWCMMMFERKVRKGKTVFVAGKYPLFGKFLYGEQY